MEFHLWSYCGYIKIFMPRKIPSGVHRRLFTHLGSLHPHWIVRKVIWHFISFGGSDCRWLLCVISAFHWWTCLIKFSIGPTYIDTLFWLLCLLQWLLGCIFLNNSLTSYLAEWVQYFTVDSPLLCLLQWLLGMTEWFYVPMQWKNWHHMLDEMTEWFFHLCRPHVM
jgi:hypothetical protein